MSRPHAQTFDVITVRPLGEALRDAPSTSLIKTDTLQLLHLVLHVHEDRPEHRVSSECVYHCLEGEVEVNTPGGSRRLHAGSLVVVAAGEPHSLRARSEAAVLAILLLNGGNAANGEHRAA